METFSIDSCNYLKYRETPWDSKVLKYRTNEVTEVIYSEESKLEKLVTKFENLCISQNILFTNTRVNPADRILRRILCKIGYQNTETSLLLELAIKNFCIDNTLEKVHLSVHHSNREDIDELKKISYQIFSHGRFFEDPFIEKEKAQLRNMNWLIDLTENSDIFLGKAHSRIVGFMAIKTEIDHVSFQLGGVKEEFTLFAYPFWYKLIIEIRNQKNVDKITAVVSANNIKILNLYSYFNFKFSASFFGYHKQRN